MRSIHAASYSINRLEKKLNRKADKRTYDMMASKLAAVQQEAIKATQERDQVFADLEVLQHKFSA